MKNQNKNTLTLDEIHEIMFRMMCHFADYCDTHGIRYYLCGGTLLGAIRHKDFIPWDDDVDILVPRPDYRRLLEWLKVEPLGECYYDVYNWERGNMCLPFTKILDLRTSVPTGTIPSLWIDIFPMDGLPEDKKQCNIFLTKAFVLKKIRELSRWQLGWDWLLRLYKVPFSLMAKMWGDAHWTERQDRWAQTYDFEKCVYVGGVATSMGPCERMKKVDFLPVVEVEFHGRTFHAPGCWKAYLTALYGDYIKLPPKKGRERGRHFLKVVWKGTDMWRGRPA